MHPSLSLLRGTLLFAILPLLLMGCAIVPKESVELSTTVGRDIVAVHEAHRNMARTLFARMKQDVNHFVDEVYAPFQIQFVLARQKAQHAAGNENNLFAVMEAAMKRPEDAQAQKDVLLVMQAIVESVHADVEEYRGLRLGPILKQEQEVTSAIERAYAQIEQGNAVVTAHLASVAKVHDAQDELLKKANLEGLRQKIGVALSKTSEQVGNFVNKAEKLEGSLDDTAAKIDVWTKELDKLTKGD